MRDDTQVSRLEKMMQKHPLFKTYALMLPPVEMKRSELKKLREGDLLVLPIHHPKLELWSEGKRCATVRIESRQSTLLIVDTEEKKAPKPTDSKKYEILFPLFGFVQSREMKAETRIDRSTLDMLRVRVHNANRQIAHGRLVRAGDRIAIEIEKVER